MVPSVYTSPLRKIEPGKTFKVERRTTQVPKLPQIVSTKMKTSDMEDSSFGWSKPNSVGKTNVSQRQPDLPIFLKKRDRMKGKKAK